MEFSRTKLKINLYGDLYEMKRPSVDESQNYARRVKDKDDGESMELLKEFLENLGLPGKALGEMEIDHLTQLMEGLMPGKKK